MPPPSFTATLWDAYDFVAAIFIVLDIALIIGLAYSIARSWRFRPGFHASDAGGHHGASTAPHKPTMHDIVMNERWHTILEKFKSGTPEAARLAIIEADALVDTALKSMRIEGEHLADRLSNLEDEEIRSMPRIWRAHRVRNDLVHTPGFAIAPHDAERSMQDYEAFLREINAIK